MPKKRSRIEQLLSGLGLGGEFHALVVKGVQEDWSPLEFEQALRRSARFQRKFRGLIGAGGDVRPFLSPTNNLGEAIRNYRTLELSYGTVLSNIGARLTPRLMEALIRGQKSPDELATAAQAVYTIRQNPELAEQYNAVLRAAGRPTLDEVGILRFAARGLSRDFYDIYEAAQFGAQLGFAPGRALEAAQAAGAPGQLANVQELVDFVRSNRADIGPELTREGISETDLIQLASGSDPRGIAGRLQALVANRRALGQFAPGFQARRGTGGGISLFPAGETTPD